MELMKSLIYKDLYIMRKTILMTVGMYLGFIILGMLVYESLESGNLAAYSDIQKESVSFVTGIIMTYCTSAILFINILGYYEVLDSDFLSRWMSFQYSSPVSELKFGISKMLTIVVMGFSALGISVIHNLILKNVYDISFGIREFKVLFLIMTASTLAAVPVIVLTCFFKRSSVAVFAVMMLCSFAVVFTMGYFIYKAAGQQDPYGIIMSIVDKLFPYAVIAFAAALVAGALLTAHVLKRRER